MKFMQIKPQKARGKLQESYWTDPQWVAEEKYDGDRRIAQFVNGDVRFTGTRESVDGTGFVEKTANLPHLNGVVTPHAREWQAIKAGKALDGTVLDGEIVAPWAKDLPGGKSKYVTSIMGSEPERALALQKQHGWLEYMVFDCLWYKGRDIRREPLAIRRAHAGLVLGEWGNKYAGLVPRLDLPLEKRFKQLVAGGGEGVVLKRLDHTYGDEKLWVKVKGEWTADVVITGFEEGKGKYAGSVGAIRFGQSRGEYVNECGTCSGFSDKLRDSFHRGRKSYIGRVIEIMHNGREATGAFRHPRFKRFRDDKSPRDCVWREDEI